MEALDPPFVPPTLRALETVVEYGLTQPGCGRTFADCWDIARFFSCACSPARAERLACMNRTQRIPAPVACSDC